MKPEQFIRDFGVEKAREVVEGIPSKYMECYYSTLCYCTKAKKYSDRFNPRIELVNMADLKRLVESLEIIDKCGGLYGFKTYCNGDYSQEDLQAIRDHESIYGGGDE
ncbi:hypothetical protein [Acinetobacter baumannii]|uniref:hypothetical protein n=1 Tax=Acinetobacter baumannii TaxID=470 RepID=UPI000D01F985|nr:hypothetical protein [Acinetobacter baumannii]MBV6560637.1 hypothetical protein [Acinetobacter baumannii]MBV6589286.1 hypothetical protein [Acinetobacter baumannii]PRO08200.1 hypothetical protein B9W31_20000 [Acinetobacter baumannii]PRO27378.1 hypothetical protein B9W57_05100 [Acinetobacter baumannii]PRO30024.1 hypothetical protein B9W69_19155 [Acinetobacter baumannii]